MATKVVAFSSDDKKELRKLGASDAQIEALRRRLPVIAASLERQPPSDAVRHVLLEARRHARSLARIASESDSGELAEREAIGHLGMASGRITGEPTDGSGVGTLPELPNFAAAARLLQAITERAVEMAPIKQRHGRLDPGRAVQLLLQALWTPEDAASRSFAQKVRPASDVSSRNPFAELAHLVFERATGKEAPPLRAAVAAWSERPDAMQWKLRHARAKKDSCSQGG